MIAHYKIGCTELADAFIRAHSDRETALKVLAETIKQDVPPGELLDGLAAFQIGDQWFVATSNGDGVVLVDTATMEEGPVLTAGPFKGKKLMMPKPDTPNRS